MRIEIICMLFLISFVNIKCLADFKSENIFNTNETYILEVGKITYETINHQKEFTLNSGDNRNILINFFSINCDIKIKTYINDSYVSNKINNMRNNDSISIYLKSDEIVFSKIKVIHLNKNKNKYNSCPLMINTIYEENSSLEFTGNKPTILFFDKNLKEINISYNFVGDNFTTFSFILNDIAKLKITYSYGNDTKVKIISNSNKIFLPNLFEINEDKIINITIKRDDSNENPILLTLKVFTDNSGPMILHSNYLNQGFITSNFNTQYFYINISKDDEGEIILHDKRQKGKLFARICNINENNCSADKIDGYMNGNERENENIEFNEYNKSLSFIYKQTKNCENGCLLLITYQDDIKSENNIIIGYDFTLLVRIWNREDWNTLEIINIPNNEYICGIFHTNSINHHYYSAFVSNDTEKIILQIKSNYLEGFAGKGKKKLNTFYYDELNNTQNLKLGDELIITLENNLINTNNYISFTFRPKNLFDNELSFYYFRIFQLKNNDELILPMDSNYINIWNPNIAHNTNNSAYFIWKNDYNELSLNCSLFDFNSAFEISYIENNDKEYDISQEKLNNICSNGNFSDENIFSGEIGYNSNINYILFRFCFEKKEFTNKRVLSTIYNKKEIIKPQIYSPEIYQLDYNTTFHFLELKQYSLIVSWVNGEGEIRNLFNNNHIFKLNKNNHDKTYSFFVENLENVTAINNNNFVFFMSVNYMTKKNNLREIEIRRSISEVIKYNNKPLYYYIKNIYNKTIYLNYRLLDIYNASTEFSIEGMLYNASMINDIIDDDYYEFKSAQKGYYDLCSKNGFLELYPQISVNEEYNKNPGFYIIKIDALIDKSTNLLIETYAIDMTLNNTIDIFIPVNQFISASFNLIEKKEYNFLFRFKEASYNDSIISEFSKNYKDIDIKINTYLNQVIEPNKKDGFVQYIFNEETSDSINIRLNKSYNANNNDLPIGFFMFRYYYDENKDNDNFVFNCSYTLSREYNKNITLKFESKSIQNLNSSENTYNNRYQIYSNIFSNESREELLNTTSFIYTEPINKKLLIAYITNDSFIFNLPIDNETLKNYDYSFIMQIKVSIDNNNDYQQNKILTYLIDLDLNELKEQNEKGNNNDDKKGNGNNSSTLIIIVIVAAIIIVIVLLFGIVYFKMAKKNKNLMERIKSISFIKENEEDEEDIVI